MNIELNRVPFGGIFTLDGVRFARLKDEDGGAILVVTEDIPDDIGCTQFEAYGQDREDHNNFAGSLVQAEISKWLSKHKPIADAATERPIDLTTMDGMTDYGHQIFLGRLLTADEYRRNRRFIPLASAAFWLATGWTTASSPLSDAIYAYFVITDGALFSDSVYSAYFAPRPALYLKSDILVSFDEFGETWLEGYTDLDLLDELFRRAQDRICPAAGVPGTQEEGE